MRKPKMETETQEFDLGPDLKLWVRRYEKDGERKYRLTVTHEENDDDILDISHNEIKEGMELHKEVKEFLTSVRKDVGQTAVDEDLVASVLKFIRVGPPKLPRADPPASNNS